MPVNFENGVLHLYGEIEDARQRPQVYLSDWVPGPEAIGAVVRVGEGRGFVVEGERRYVITAAHCLPHLPPAGGITLTEERTYAQLLASLGEQPAVWTECLFVDPIADLAVLGSPGGQALWSEADAYVGFIIGSSLN